MTGYDEESIGRSIRRYLGLALGEPWNIELERVDVRDDERPAGFLEFGTRRVRFARNSRPQGEVEEYQPITVSLYPALMVATGDPDVPPTEYLPPREAGRNARLLSTRLQQLIVTGADGPRLADGRPASGPEHLPLWDYTGIGLDSAGPATPFDVLLAEDYSVRPVQDPVDVRRWTVIAELRVSWWRPGAVDPATVGAPTVTSMPGAYDADAP